MKKVNNAYIESGVNIIFVCSNCRHEVNYCNWCEEDFFDGEKIVCVENGKEHYHPECWELEQEDKIKGKRGE